MVATDRTMAQVISAQRPCFSSSTTARMRWRIAPVSSAVSSFAPISFSPLTLLPLNKDIELARPNGCDQGGMVAFALVGIGNGEVGDGFIKHVPLAEVTADHDRIARASMRAG